MIPPIQVKGRNITIPIPSEIVAFAGFQPSAATIYPNTFTVGGCTL
jgi:hypothetical protein